MSKESKPTTSDEVHWVWHYGLQWNIYTLHVETLKTLCRASVLRSRSCRTWRFLDKFGSEEPPPSHLAPPVPPSPPVLSLTNLENKLFHCFFFLSWTSVWVFFSADAAKTKKSTRKLLSLKNLGPHLQGPLQAKKTFMNSTYEEYPIHASPYRASHSLLWLATNTANIRLKSNNYIISMVIFLPLLWVWNLNI